MTNGNGKRAESTAIADLVAGQPASRVTPVPAPGTRPHEFSGRWRIFTFATLGLLLCFSLPLWFMVKFAWKSDLYSYILLIPFLCLYLVWPRRFTLPVPTRAARGLSILFFSGGVALLVGYCLTLNSANEFAPEDYLAWAMGSLYLFFLGICALVLGTAPLRAMAFALGMLIFIVPLPSSVIDAIDVGLQHSSARTAYAMFKLSGTPVQLTYLTLHLSVIPLRVAPECSGIHSSIVLFITSLVAGYLFLKSPWKRALFTLAVIPLGILRNGFRIYTLGELCVHVNRNMIDSWIHHKGGPVFFGLSLIPMFLLLVFFRRTEQPQAAR